MVVRGVVVLMVDTHDERGVLVGGGRRDDDLLGAAINVGVRLERVREDAGRLDDNVDVERAPRDLSRVAFFEDAHGLATNGDGLRVGADGVREHTENRVVLEQVRDGLVVHQVVRRNDFDVSARGLHRTVEVAANSAKAVDANTNSHETCCLPGGDDVPPVWGTRNRLQPIPDQGGSACGPPLGRLPPPLSHNVTRPHNVTTPDNVTPLQPRNAASCGLPLLEHVVRALVVTRPHNVTTPDNVTPRHADCHCSSM